jgi:tRNA 2-thiouridine synthesizing protein A
METNKGVQDSVQDKGAIRADAELDLRGVICPYNFVKTKLKLETMDPGQTLAVILDDGDPIKNVPRSVSDDGHTVLLQEPWAQAYRVIIQKRLDG